MPITLWLVQIKLFCRPPGLARVLRAAAGLTASGGCGGRMRLMAFAVWSRLLGLRGGGCELVVLGPERHGGRVPAGLWARIIQQLLALNTVIWHNWMIGAPVKRSLIAYDH